MTDTKLTDDERLKVHERIVSALSPASVENKKKALLSALKRCYSAHRKRALLNALKNNSNEKGKSL